MIKTRFIVDFQKRSNSRIRINKSIFSPQSFLLGLEYLANQGQKQQHILNETSKQKKIFSNLNELSFKAVSGTS